MFVNIAKYCESIQDVIRSLIETTTKPTQPLLSSFYCKILRNYSRRYLIFDRNDDQTNPTPLIIILLQNIAKLFKSYDLWQKWSPNLPNPYHHFAAKYCEPIQVIVWRRYLISDRPDFQTYPTPYRPSVESDYHFDDVHNTICETKQAPSAWMTGQAIARGMHVQDGRRQRGQGGSWPQQILPE